MKIGLMVALFLLGALVGCNDEASQPHWAVSCGDRGYFTTLQEPYIKGDMLYFVGSRADGPKATVWAPVNLCTVTAYDQ